MRKQLLIFSWLVLLSSASAEAQGVDPAAASTAYLGSEVWLSLDGEWREAPEDPREPFRGGSKVAPATIAVFSSHRQLALVECFVYSGDRLEIAENHPLKIHIGTWDLRGEEIETRFRLYYDSVGAAAGGEYPGPEERATALRLEGKKIQLRGKRFEAGQAHDFDGSEIYLPPYRLQNCDPEKASRQCRIEGLP